MTQATHLPHITHYQIVSATDAAKMHNEVETAIHQGWQPYGSLVVDGSDDGARYVQTMVRYAEWSM